MTPAPTHPLSSFFNDTPTTEIYTLSLHDALPILAARRRPWCAARKARSSGCCSTARSNRATSAPFVSITTRSEEHTSELQSQSNLVCRLLLEKKKRKKPTSPPLRDMEHTTPLRCG